ncbi:MBL fold metallo-hydrolase [Variovorax sp. PCZ-1]|uniref:MBL fold metallo-hydrolase n=1 Tax=Variovorax sp. PCZ-1 TaxID=2835533 RepID=UPI001BCE4610|nr:MBL fold metallo-hydrolase [Variovorax sp. PCZ-1]MBS7808350.1 MBL fold metallo-hydrolase [Variovorax sp. PCZ-1]
MIKRRDIFVGSGAAAVAYMAGSFMPLIAQNAPSFGAPSVVQVGFRKQKLGDMEIIALNDGVARRPLAAEFVRNAPMTEVQALLQSQGLPTEYIDIPFTAFMIVAGNRRILLDTGFADNGGPTTGRLLANLNAAGFKAEDIDTVVLTHYHGDHINGVRNKAGQLVFPKAKIMVPTVEHAFWMDDARMAAAPEAMKGAFQAVRRVLGGLTADQLIQFEPGKEILPGINSVAAFGHTPGHSLITAQSKGEKFAYLADLTNIPQLFARNPDWAVQFDMNADAARDTRRKMFEMVINEKMLAGGFHFPFPAFGRVEKLGNGYDFKPVA